MDVLEIGTWFTHNGGMGGCAGDRDLVHTQWSLELLHNGTFLWDKIFANCLKVRILGKYFSRIASYACVTGNTTTIFAKSLQFEKFAKSFSHKYFPLYGKYHYRPD